MTSSSSRVLVVDERRAQRAWAQEALSGVARLETCESAAAALAIAAREPVDVVVAGSSGGDGGPRLVERLHREYPGTDVLLLCPAEAAADVEPGVDALSVPAPGSQLRRRVEQILLRRQLSADNSDLRERLAVADACRSLTSTLEPGKVYPAVLDLLLERLGRRRGLALFRRTSPLGDAVAFRGFSEVEAGRLRTLLTDQKRVDPTLYDGVDVVGGGPLLTAFRTAEVEPGALLAVALRGEQEEAGIVWIFDDGRPFEQRELELAERVVGYATDALLNSERYHNAKERAFIDDVTEVYNVRYLLSTTENEIRRAERYDAPLSVLFLDLDRFKLVNDRHGHLIGSETLRSLSALLGHCVRNVDTLARYGGDEFTILLIDTEHEAALAIAERIRRTVEENVFEAGREASLRLTISIGVASCPRHATERDALLDAADKAMYRSKSLGRNRVCSASEL